MPRSNNASQTGTIKKIELQKHIADIKKQFVLGFGAAEEDSAIQFKHALKTIQRLQAAVKDFQVNSKYQLFYVQDEPGEQPTIEIESTSQQSKRTAGPKQSKVIKSTGGTASKKSAPKKATSNKGTVVKASSKNKVSKPTTKNQKAITKTAKTEKSKLNNNLTAANKSNKSKK